jgi:hypothetical protein
MPNLTLRLRKKIEANSPPTQLCLTATAHIEIEAAADGTSNALPRFQMVGYTGGPMRVAGWPHPVILDLAGLSIPSQSRPIRFAHDPLSGVGHTDAIRVDQGQLVATGGVSRELRLLDRQTTNRAKPIIRIVIPHSKARPRP